MNRSRLFDVLIVRSWWVILFLLTSLLIFDVTMRMRQEEEKRLLAKVTKIEEQLHHSRSLQHHLHAELASHDDPQWIELLLMRNLGLVPDGYTKLTQ